MEPDRVDQEDCVEDEVAEERNYHEELPAISVRERPGEEDKEDPWDALKHRTVGLRTDVVMVVVESGAGQDLQSGHELLGGHLLLLV